MAIKKRGKYLCSYCYKEYVDATQADVCRDTHDLIYVPLTREDILALNAFLYTKNDKDLTESLVRQLRKYRKLTQRKPKGNR